MKLMAHLSWDNICYWKQENLWFYTLTCDLQKLLLGLKKT